ncbi:hypothetical protein HPB52_011670 [Rhipicephalus sanguineus]|uniref:HTH CENPB-type domain-containing protein n=1 Tax=Rhipicephalus sanguineus TaxID=34632 RepID=A0A9D4SUW5_RHISA|nr:hypothetical protein HPB52_011670 [Rhipicephalus sanguineus]
MDNVWARKWEGVINQRRGASATGQSGGLRRSFQEPKNGAFPDVERELMDFVREQRAAHLVVNIKLLQAKASEITRDTGIQQADFKASKH